MRERREAWGLCETEEKFLLIYAFMGCFLYVPWWGIEPTTLAYQDDALTNMLPGEGLTTYSLCLNSVRHIIDTQCLLNKGRNDLENEWLWDGQWFLKLKLDEMSWLEYRTVSPWDIDNQSQETGQDHLGVQSGQRWEEYQGLTWKVRRSRTPDTTEERRGVR